MSYLVVSYHIFSDSSLCVSPDAMYNNQRTVQPVDQALDQAVNVNSAHKLRSPTEKLNVESSLPEIEKKNDAFMIV